MKLLRWLDDNFEAIVMVISLSAMSIIIAVQVFFRYVLLNSLSWSEEVSRYLFIYMIYFGIAYGVRKNRHIKIDVVLTVLPETARKVISLTADLLFLGFAVVVTTQAGIVAEMIGRLGQITGATQMPMAVVYMAVPLGYGLVCVRLLQNIFHKLTHFTAPFETYVYRGDSLAIIHPEAPEDDSCADELDTPTRGE